MLRPGIGSMIECDGNNDGGLRSTHVFSKISRMTRFLKKTKCSSSSSTDVQYFIEGLYVVLTSC